MDLSTRYAGLSLRSPLVAGASPLADDLGTALRLDDAGVGAIVMRSLFEEQLEMEAAATAHAYESHADFFAEAQSFLPKPTEFVFGPDPYLNQLRKLKERVSCPVIASLNGTTAAGWLEFAVELEQAGADAIELNLYHLATDPMESASHVEARVIDVARTVKGVVKVPVTVKLSPYYSALAHLVHDLDATGIDGLVLFNRFYQPDIDPETLEVTPTLKLSDPSELLLRLRWLAVLSPKIKASLACSGGVHHVRDVVRALMAGADAVQLVSCLLQRGPRHVATLTDGLRQWLEEKEYAGVMELVGTMNLAKSPNPAAFERASYMRILSSWRPPA